VFKSCCLGCGGRARGHADAYRFVRKGRLEAVCDMNEERLRPFAEQWKIPRAYTNLDEMLETEKPDLLHIVTQPQLRVELLSLACQHEVPAVLVEKPLCLDADDFNAITKLGESTKTRICVNHQLRFHPQTLRFLGLVRGGAIGDIRLIDASARLGQAGQGTHILNLVFAYADCMRPTSVLAQASGATKWLSGNHPCPDMTVSEIEFDNGVRAIFSCGANGPVCGDPSVDHMHKRIAVYGTQGFVHWMMNAWELGTEGSCQSGEKSYREEDVQGQAAMTDAIFTWLEDETTPHPNRLEVSLAESNTVLGIYKSAVERRRVSLPLKAEGSYLAALRETL